MLWVWGEFIDDLELIEDGVVLDWLSLWLGVVCG